jgi:hypothetical protein
MCSQNAANAISGAQISKIFQGGKPPKPPIILVPSARAPPIFHEVSATDYTVAWRYDFYLLVLKTIFYSLAALVRKTLFLPLEDKSNIFAPPCIKYPLYNIIWYGDMHGDHVVNTLIKYCYFLLLYNNR